MVLPYKVECILTCLSRFHNFVLPNLGLVCCVMMLQLPDFSQVVPIIDIPGFGSCAAQQICVELGIQSQVRTEVAVHDDNLRSLANALHLL